MNREDCVADAAAYALGALEPDEAEAYERHMSRCPACAREVAAMQRAAGALPLSAPQYRLPSPTSPSRAPRRPRRRGRATDRRARPTERRRSRGRGFLQRRLGPRMSSPADRSARPPRALSRSIDRSRPCAIIHVRSSSDRDARVRRQAPARMGRPPGSGLRGFGIDRRRARSGPDCGSRRPRHDRAHGRACRRPLVHRAAASRPGPARRPLGLAASCLGMSHAGPGSAGRPCPAGATAVRTGYQVVPGTHERAAMRRMRASDGSDGCRAPARPEDSASDA